MKPDDVPQWAWDQAKTKDGFDYKQDVKIVVARAILQARSQAFEDAEKVVHSCASLDENGYICEKSAAIQAIRQHSQKGEDNEGI